MPACALPVDGTRRGAICLNDVPIYRSVTQHENPTFFSHISLREQNRLLITGFVCKVKELYRSLISLWLQRIHATS
jgi:hypothetical protein